MTSVPPLEEVNVFNIGGVFQGSVPLRTRAFETWPKSLHVACLHCGSECSGCPIPAVRFFETQLNLFWVFGPFCSPPCAFGYITENESSAGSKQMALTVHVLRTYFGVTDISIAPPRGSHQRYGGPLSDVHFKGLANVGVIDVLSPPFVA